MITDYPISPYSSSEQMRIIHDLERHLEEAKEQRNIAGIYYTREALKEAKG